MSARWDAARSRAQRVAVSYFGETVTYTPASDVALVTPVVAVFQNEYVGVDPATQMPVTTTGPMFSVLLRDLPKRPEQDDRIVRENGDVYLVVDIRPDGQGMADLLCHAQQPSAPAPSLTFGWPT